MTDCKTKISVTIFALVALTSAATAGTNARTSKTRLDIRVVRSPQHDTAANTAYVLAPQYHQAVSEEDSSREQQHAGYTSVISEAQYESLLKQAQKALQGYDLTKISAPQHPEEEQTKAQVVYKPDVSIKYVYKDAPASVTYNTAAFSYAYPGHSDHQDHDHQDDYSHHKFGYRVHDPHSGAAFGHSEVSEGHVTKGQYHVLLPDGRLQSVKYVADEKGYHAKVSYEQYKQYH